MTAWEHAVQLEKDPEYRERMRRLEEERAQMAEEHKKAERPVVHALQDIGLDVGSIQELLQRHAPLQANVVEVLIDQLPQISDIAVREAVVRALAASEQPFDGRCLVQLFEDPENDLIRWPIANTMAEARPTGISDWLARAVREPSYGKSREMLFLALARLTPAAAAIPILLSLFDEFPGHIAMALGEVGGAEQIPFLEQAIDKTSGWVKKAVRQAIGRISRRVAKAKAREQGKSTKRGRH